MSPVSVSVLVTTYNHARFVEAALESLRAQTRQDFEVIITDDASTDGTADVVSEWLRRTGSPYRFIRNRTNRGICANRNAALGRAAGAFVCSLSGDDVYAPDRIERQLAWCASQPDDVAATYGDMMIIREDGTETGLTYLTKMLSNRPRPEDSEVFSRLLRSNFMPAPAVMVRRAAFDAVGPYDESLINEDYDMWLRLSHRFRFRHLPRVVMQYRMLPHSLSHSPATIDAFEESRGRVLSKWAGRSGPENDLLIANRLWVVGRRQLRRRRDSEAARNLLLAAALSGRMKRRLAATAARFEIGRAVLRGARLL